MNEIVERLLVLAAPRKKKPKKKYSSAVENAFDDLLMYMVDKSDYDQSSRAFRLLLRIQRALESEGFRFVEKSKPASPSSPLAEHAPVGTSNLLYDGGLVMLLRHAPPEGLGVDDTVRLFQYIGSKQCYRFSISPVDKSSHRRSGVNLALPKPVTWSKLENYGMIREPIVTQDGRVLLEQFVIDGVKAYTLDRKTFFTQSAAGCRRWVSSVDRAIANIVNR